MTSKKTPASKRTPLPRVSDYTKSFLKDVMLLLITNNAALGPEWLDHPLRGNWEGYRECHVGGDFLLVYRLGDAHSDGGSIIFVRNGTHAELFE